MSILSDSARHEYYTTLANSLPPPVLNEAEYSDRRLIAAVETFNALCPGDAYEARLAVRIVLCGAHANESLRLAGRYRDDFGKLTRCRAQAASMMRAESAAKRTLEREQKMRLAVEAVAGAAPGQPAAASAPPQQAEPQAPPPVQVAAAAPPSAPEPPEAAPEPPPAAPPRPAAANPAPSPAPAGSVPPPSPEAIAKAEALARGEIVAAAQIRHDRGVTLQSGNHFRNMTLPTDPAITDALVRNSTDALTLRHEAGGEMLDAAD